ncbi:ATP-dependent DNA helicase pif1 [Zea mays]|uniref:ATP-dependent DNA helicase n=1 Tax=Zea mays TaxID=4577 RepID=A0A3L6EGZ4_MAIZE|nr:ATP-dependent DNA helicase pif1 [Zea mays]
MSDEQKNEKNKKRREARLRNKELNKKLPEARQRNNCQNMMPNAPRGGDKKVNVDPNDDSDCLHINYTIQSNDIDAPTEVLTPGSVHETVGHTPKHTTQRTAYFSERYKNLTPVEKEFRRERLRLYNRTPRRKEAKVDHNRRRRVMQADTLNPTSIAMEDPTYTPEFVHPTTDAKGSDGSILSVCDWVIPEFVNAPFLPSPTQAEDVASPDMSTNTLKRKHHVPRGERQAILARRNQLFESAISRKVGTSIENTSGDVVEGDDWTQRHTPMKITNNGDDDEGVIFEDDDDENEGYLFAAQYEDTDEDIEIDGTQDESTATYVSDPYDKVYNNIPEETHMLKLVPNCGYCTAKKFEYEPPGFCCRGGKVELALVETPPQLKRLWDSADSDARHFRDNIRFFNGHFSFTSLYCCLDSMTTNVRDSGIYTFRAQGMMYHNIKSFGREDGAEHKHLELYFYDDDPSLEHRYRKCREEHQQKDKEVIKQIVDILRGNPYSKHLRTMGHVDNLDDYRIALNLDQTLNQKTYNAPLTSEVAAVWIEGSEGRGQFSKSVMLHGKDSSRHCIRSYHGCYDALSYPLFFPRGKLGWHANIPKVGVSMDEVDAYHTTHRASNANDEDAESPSHLCVFVRDYYCYKFQIRPGVFNPILHGKRLFQQFAVDTYIKIESSRLDFIRVDRSMLTAYFEANSLHKEARGILYRDFPEWYTWQSGKGKIWQKRKRDTGGQVGRIVSAHPAEGERYYLRVLLNHVTGATSYVDLRTVDGVTLPTFREAAERRGLLESDNTLDECLTERALFQMPSALRRLFATILVYCEPSDVVVLWQKHLDSMFEDYQHRNPCKTHVEQMVLIDIRNMLQSMGKDIKKFPLPPIMDAYDDAIGTAREVYEEEIIEPAAEDVALKDCLNKEQRAAYDKILSAVDTDQGGLFFVDGPGGTGKTYLYRVLLATLRSQGKIAVATATSSVAASIMPGGRTAHSRFKIPLTIDDGAVCSFTKQSGTAELLRKASLIIWDEASMTKRQAVEALDNSMHDIMGRPGLPFGGKTIVFGGDFRQVLPVVRKGTRAQVVASSLRMSYLWESMSHLKLVTNMRAKTTLGEHMVYHSFDSAMDDPHNYYPPEFLNTLTPNGLPPHVLNLKIGCPVILLRNIDPANGLCNGTRLVVRGFQRNSIDAKIVLGQHAGKQIFLPRIPLCPSDEEMFPFQFKRKQFHVRLSFAMTVNKAQGQTIPNVGVYLPELVFSHGQLYVALSRATARSNIKILAIPPVDGKKTLRKRVRKNPTVDCGTYTKNIVYKEVLTN